MLDGLLAEHVDDGTGHCRVCALGGQKGFQRWPCNVRAAVDVAAEHRAGHR